MTHPMRSPQLGTGTAALLSGGIAAVGWGVLLLVALFLTHLGHTSATGGFGLLVFALFGYPVPVALAAAGAATSALDGRSRNLRVAVRWALGATTVCAIALAELVVRTVG